MSFHSWWTYTITVFLICASPGPNMLQMMNSSVQYGYRRTFFSMAGCFLGVLLLIGGSVVGVGALLAASPATSVALHYVGGCYLVYLGVQSWRVPVAATIDCEAPDISSISPGAIFCNGFFVAISNPKALFFAAAFFPQFINPEAEQWPQLLIMLGTFSVLEILWYNIYALGGSRLAGYMANVRVRRNFYRCIGSLFIVFGLLLLVKSA